jgi:osmotically-inducible protein OsmY
MKLRLAAIAMAAALTVFAAGCSKKDKASADQAREKARTEAHKLSTEAKQEAQKLSTEAKQEAQKLGSEVDKGMNGSPSPSVDQAERKLQHAGQVAGHGTLIARVKTKLAADVGLDTMSTVRVDVKGSVVTLSGTIVGANQKRLAEQSAAQVTGVSRVVNNLIEVEPGG